MADDLDAALDELFANAPDTFLSAREEIAKRLKSAGDKDGAAAIKAQHKPTLVAHALNRLARDAKPELEEVLAAGRALAAGKDFKAALERQRASLDAILKKVTGPDVPAVMSVLRGAQSDPELGAQLLAGHFSKLPEVKVGFFGAIPDAPVQHEKPAHHEKPDKAHHKAGESAAEKHARDAAEKAAEKAAKQEADRKEREAEQHRRALAAAEKHAATLEAAAEKAEAHARDARRKADEAAAEVKALRR